MATLRRSTARATTLVALSACCFGSIPIFTELATATGAPLVSVLGWRYLLAAALFVALVGGPANVRLSRGHLARILAVGGGGQAAIAFLTLSSLAFIPAATLGFLFYTYPAWVALIAALRRSEPLTARRLGALALSLVGITVMVGSPWSAPMHPAGVALALGGAVAYAMYIPLIDYLQRGTTPAVVSAWIAVGACMLLLGGGLLSGTLSVDLAPTAWGAVVGLAVVSTVLAFLAFLRGLAVLGPVRTAIVSTVEPFWIALLGAVVLGDAITGGTVIGGVLIAAAVLLLQWRGNPDAPEAPEMAAAPGEP